MDPLEHLIGQEPDPQAYTGHGLRAPDPQLYTGQRRIVTPVIQGSGGGYLTPDYWGHVRSNAPDAPLATSSSQTLVSSTGTGGSPTIYRALAAFSRPFQAIDGLMLGLRGYRAGRSPLSAHYLQLDPIIEKPADLSVVTWNTQGALTYGAGLTLVFVLPAIDTAPADSVGLGGSFTPSERGLMVYNWSVPEAMWGFRLRLDSDESYGSNSEEAGFDFDGNLSDVRVFGA